MPYVDNYQGAHLPGGQFIANGGESLAGVAEADQLSKDWIGLRQPYISERWGVPCVTINRLDKFGYPRYTVEKGERKAVRESTPVSNLFNDPRFRSDPWTLLTANATSMRKADWIELDRSVLMAARQRLRAWADLSAANSYGGFNGMGKMTLEYEAMSDPGEAIVDMDGLTDGRTDSPLYKLRSLPLPITHSDFWFSERRLAVSRNSTPLDTTMAEAASRRVGEMIEKTLIGVTGGFSGFAYGAETSSYAAHDTTAPTDGHGSALGGSTVYGYTTYPHRLTKTNFTAPTGSNATTTLTEVLAAIEQLAAQRFYGPFVLYHSTDWSPYMNNVFSASGGNNPSETLRSMLLKVPEISDVRRLDFLTSTFTLLFVQMQRETAMAVNGMPITTVQWQSQGGMRTNFKVMAIQVPLLRSDYEGRCGILHGTTA